MKKETNKQAASETSYLALGLSLGLLFGSAVGLVFGIAVDDMTFMTIFTGGGLTLGIAIGAGLEQMSKKD